MKQLLWGLVCLLLTCCCVNGQQNDLSKRIQKETFRDRLDSLAVAAPFYYVIKDVRANKSGISCRPSGKKIVRLELDSPLETYMQDYFNLPGNDQHTKLYCYITQFRYIERDSFNHASAIIHYATARLGVDFFIRDGNHLKAARRMDTSFNITLLPKHIPAQILRKMFNCFAARTASINVAKAQSKTPFTEGYVDSIYSNRFNYPVLKDTVKEGIYLTLQEFLNNAPSIREFKIEKDKKTQTIFYKTEDNKWLRANAMAGYCSGKNLFLKYKGILCPAIRTGQSFELLARKDLFVTNSNSFATNILLGVGMMYASNMNNSGPVKSGMYVPEVNTHVIPNLYELDAETGEIF